MGSFFDWRNNMYKGNSSLRGAGEKVAMSEKQIEEYIKCKNDIIYFAENYFYVQTLKYGRQLIKLYDYQKMILKAFVNPPNGNRHVCLLSSRQMGKSCLASIYFTHCALFEKDNNIIILANKEATSKDILQKIKIAYERFPLWLQKGVLDGGWNKNTIQLENGITVLAASSSSDSIRGKSSSRLYVDETAFIPDHIWPEFWNSIYSTISTGTNSKIILTSTPKGLNHFYDIYSQACKGENGFYPIKVTWRSHPDRDKSWAEQTLKEMGGDLRSFAQEHDCSFLGSSSTLVNPDILERISTENPIDIKYNGAMAIYEHPRDKAFYILGIDPARGTGNDFSTIQVLKINSDKDVDQVAIYQSEYVDPETFAEVCVGVSEYYNNAQMMVESNDIGSLVCDKIFYDLENENLINFDKNGLGIRATRKTKLAANLLLKKYIENGFLQINDKKTLYELSRYVEKTPGVYHAAGENDHDDTVTALEWALYFLVTDFYDPNDNGKSSYTNNNSSRYDENERPAFLSSSDVENFNWL